MAEFKNLLDEGKRHRIVVTDKRGKQLIELQLIWAVIITLVAPQLAVLVLVGALLNVVTVALKEAEDQH